MHTQNHQLDGIFQALSDSTRRNILMRVLETEDAVSNIAAQYDMSMPAVTKHLDILERTGLITRRKEGRRRLCKANPEQLTGALEWLTYYQNFWNSNLDSLKRFIETDTSK